ncbi:DUF302 domain-containing protein [Microbacter margulisiae]|uniref:Uncharacterized protein (DUF302 family) n=1 Tax=Microbacter margulisiae TaxID=1350067 RepID=A0A7W5DNQ7_9PORP|nr:DUF302 domain-containing protein [Microbacter margulisiae]MBB3186284.1 uncharacterized protein (DUF302 family) [Microbacter margulisiae]
MNSIFIEQESKYDFDETVEKLIVEIRKTSWKISVVNDLQQSLEEYGQKVLPVKVLALCNPAYASQLLTKDEMRIVSPLMPCRISIYQKSDGKTYISRMNFLSFARLLDRESELLMTASHHEVEEIMKSVLVSASVMQLNSMSRFKYGQELSREWLISWF